VARSQALARWRLAAILPYGRGVGTEAFVYRRREPEKTVLYQTVQEHLDTFLARLAGEGESLPGYVESAFEAYLDCGMLQKGFARFYCGECGHSRLVAFS